MISEHNEKEEHVAKRWAFLNYQQGKTITAEKTRRAHAQPRCVSPRHATTLHRELVFALICCHRDILIKRKTCQGLRR